MGSQVNFYVCPDEQAWFEGILRDQGDFAIVTGMASSSQAAIAKTTLLLQPGREQLGIYLCRPPDLDKIAAIKIPARSGWAVDVLRSPVVEFSRCFSDGYLLGRGRLYFVRNFLGSHGKTIEKSEPFTSWARSLVGAVRRRLVRLENGSYIAPETSRAVVSKKISLKNI